MPLYIYPVKIRVLAPIRNAKFDFSELSIYGKVKIIDGEILDNKINLSKDFKEAIGGYSGVC